ncbi:MAG: hypothetical protein AAGA54_22060 [Myxococcota bacterium]
MARHSVVLVLSLVAFGCGTSADAFNCAEDSQCQDGGAEGLCEANGFCSFPDPACESGRRFGDNAGTLSDRCVSVEAGTSGGVASSSSSSTSAQTSTSTGSTGGSGDAGSSSGEQCGNDQLDPGEACDETANPNCVDCQYVSECGNGVTDPGEACDVWGGEAAICSADCRERVVFAWDGATANAGLCDKGGECGEWRFEDGRMLSGEYVDSTGLLVAITDVTMVSGTLTIPPLLDGQRLSVSLAYEHALNEIGEGAVDHGVVALEPAGSTGTQDWTLVLPSPATTAPVSQVVCDIASACVQRRENQAFCDPDYTAALGGTTPFGTYETTLPAEAVEAGDYRLLFRLRYDCANTGISPAEDDAWQIASVRMSVQAAD